MVSPNHPIFVGFSIIFTIHFGGFPSIFGNTHMGPWIPLPTILPSHRLSPIHLGCLRCQNWSTATGASGTRPWSPGWAPDGFRWMDFGGSRFEQQKSILEKHKEVVAFFG